MRRRCFRFGGLGKFGALFMGNLVLFFLTIGNNNRKPLQKIVVIFCYLESLTGLAGIYLQEQPYGVISLF